MSEKLDPRLILERHRAQAIVAGTTEREAENIEDGKNPWPVFNPDARAYITIFSHEFPDAAELPDRLHAFKEAGDEVVVVDLCGIADAASIGADFSIGLTLKDPGTLPPDARQAIIEGDILTSGAIGRVHDAVREHGGKIHCLFLRPVGGLGGLGHQMRSHIRLYAALQRLYPLLAEGGDIYIELRGFPAASLLPAALNAQSATPLCKAIETRGANDIPTTMIHIRKAAGAPAVLATIDELRSIPSIENRFKQLLTDDPDAS